MSRGQQAGPYVSYAESVAVKLQNLNLFEEMLQQALSIDPDTNPDHRLANLIMQQRARWLLSQKENLFLLPDS